MEQSIKPRAADAPTRRDDAVPSRAASFSRAVAELGHVALTGLSVNEVLERACELVCSALGAEYAKVLHQPGVDEPLVLVAGTGWHRDVQIGEATVPCGADSQAGFTLIANTTVVVEDFAREDRFWAPRLLREHNVQSGMSVVIPDVSGTYGVLGVHSQHPRAYSPEEADFIRLVANVISGAVQNDRVRAAIRGQTLGQQRQLAVQGAVAECAQALLASAGEDRLGLALSALITATEATSVFVERNVHDPDLGFCSLTVAEVEQHGAWQQPDSPFWDLTPWSQMPISRFHMERGDPFLLIPEELTGPEYDLYAADPYPIKSELDIPIFANGEWAGLVGLADVDVVRRWSTEELALLKTVASMVGAFWERESARDALREMNEEKDRFIATVSHELRTPLTSVLGFAELLREEGSDADETAEMLDLLGSEATDVVNLVEDLLIMAQVGQDSLRVVAVPVSVRAQARQVLESMGHPEADSVRLEGGWGHATGDPGRVRQILRNLLTNAFRYGGSSVALIVDEQESEWVSVAVVDNGEGVPIPDRELMFEPYERAHVEVGRTESVGLGLAVCRTLGRLMGGDVTYEYVDGFSRFELRLPASPLERPAP